jgi:2-polyprenyl-3-methyl-5-hydroxy-6-metoxy-1,4-benzoquinol methylase
MSNVDIDEVNKFAALASRWWDKNDVTNWPVSMMKCLRNN